MSLKLELLKSIYKPQAVANAGLLAGSLLGAFAGLYASVVGALLGFMVDRVRAALSSSARPEGIEAPMAGEGRPDPSLILGIDPEADSAEIRRAWRRVSKQCHPDTGIPAEEGARRFREAREAYEELLASRRS